MIRHLYVHTPFCAKVCPYCAFHVHLGGAAAQREFVTALRREWRQAREEFPLALETIYFGGGTPSILSAELFVELAEELGVSTKFSLQPNGHPERTLSLSKGKSKDQLSFSEKKQTELIPRQARDDGQKEACEFTLEVNPATVTPEKAAAWRAAGVNRISLGAQSFDAEMLRLLGRQHAPEEIAETCTLLREHGFSNINIDLMFALPGQSESKWISTLEAALLCRPNHISAYALTYEEDTPFFEKLQKGEWRQNEEREIAMFTRTREILAAAGLIDYEISNFARPGFESRHNLAYWRGANYLGLGPSACSTIGEMRWRNVPDTKAYNERMARGESVREERETLDPATRARERIMFGLRMREGVALEEFGAVTARVKELEANGLAFEEAGRVRLTARGQLVADSVAGMFV